MTRFYAYDIPMASEARAMTEDSPKAEPSRTCNHSPELDSLTPAQMRMRAQNRAAQRAYREQQGGRIKELQVKVMDLENESVSIKEENARLKKELAQSETKSPMAAMSPSVDNMDLFGNPFDRRDHP